MTRGDQAAEKSERLVEDLPLHADLEPPKDDKMSIGSMIPHFTSADAQAAYVKVTCERYRSEFRLGHKWTKANAKGWASDNPGQAACYTVGAISLAVFASPALISTPALTAMGFGAKGVVANSAAAAAQAGIGNVVAPSVFATLQSAGTAGYGAAIVNGAVQAGAGVTAAGSGGYITMKRWFNGKENIVLTTASGHASAYKQDHGDRFSGTETHESKFVRQSDKRNTHMEAKI
ncbi:hypothetical protein ColTof4_01590 [Colletotrichum tofieldiae]|nr:hypothetical protein ColTof3_10129 [Colletotrichum tofieldiae]GKT69167.1 hypothetical protein ColTof4_01590 [Colletotrichum tofieldiae]GKT96540.1 hypothetical protein Ct61P_14390 [Colletotrichum tofieldiae]